MYETSNIVLHQEVSDKNCDTTRKYINFKQMEQSSIDFDSFCIIQALLWSGLNNNTNPPSSIHNPPASAYLVTVSSSWVNPSNT